MKTRFYTQGNSPMLQQHILLCEQSVHGTSRKEVPEEGCATKFCQIPIFAVYLRPNNSLIPIFIIFFFVIFSPAVTQFPFSQPKKGKFQFAFYPFTHAPRKTIFSYNKLHCIVPINEISLVQVKLRALWPGFVIVLNN